MRRSICYCEPNVALAGQSKNWKFIYTTATLLPKGTKLRFDLESKGSDLDWQLPDTNLKKKENLIWAEAEGKTFSATESTHPKKKTPSYEFTLPLEVKAGASLTIHMGSPSGEPDSGNRCQKTVQRKRPFALYIDPKGKGDYKEHETFYLDVRGGALKHLRVLSPSLVNRNKRFDVIVRFEDEYGNLTSNAPEGTLIDLSYEHLRENLNWKLFVPETGFIALPNLYFNEPGIYKIQLKNLATDELFYSAPIKCLEEPGLSLFWGLLHDASNRGQSKENTESFLRHARDDRAFQFFSLSNFESDEETSELWKASSQQVAEFNEEDRFVAMLGFQWIGEPKVEGIRQFVYSKDLKPLLRNKDMKSNSLKKIYKTTQTKDLVSIPSFTMAKTMSYDFADFNPEFERVVEIYNAWGSSECSAKEGNAFPITGGRGGITESNDGSLIQALNKGYRFGFVAGGYDNREIYQKLAESNQKLYSPGLTAILAKEHNRGSLFEALQDRSCYATTGERIVLGLNIAGSSMGSELSTKEKPGLEFNRHITGYAIGTAPLKKVELIRNGKAIHEFKTEKEECKILFDDTELLNKVAFKPVIEGPNFVYYYLRVTQEDGNMAWSSPIWIDIHVGSNGSGKAAKKTKKK